MTEYFDFPAWSLALPALLALAAALGVAVASLVWRLFGPEPVDRLCGFGELGQAIGAVIKEPLAPAEHEKLSDTLQAVAVELMSIRARLPRLDPVEEESPTLRQQVRDLLTTLGVEAQSEQAAAELRGELAAAIRDFPDLRRFLARAHAEASIASEEDFIEETPGMAAVRAARARVSAQVEKRTAICAEADRVLSKGLSGHFGPASEWGVAPGDWADLFATAAALLAVGIDREHEDEVAMATAGEGAGA